MASLSFKSFLFVLAIACVCCALVSKRTADEITDRNVHGPGVIGGEQAQTVTQSGCPDPNVETCNEIKRKCCLEFPNKDDPKRGHRIRACVRRANPVCDSPVFEGNC